MLLRRLPKRIIPFLVVLLNNPLFLFCQDDFYSVETIQEIRITFKEKNWKHILDSIFQATDGTGRWLCDVRINGQTIKKAGIRYKGFSSVDLKDLKNPFNIDLEYSQKNRNYQGYTSLRLSNVNYDPSFIREVLSYEIARKYLPAPHANFANVYINDTLIGLYSNIEAVNTKFISKHFSSNNNSFLKGSPLKLEFPFGENSNLADSHGEDSLGYVTYYSLESDYGWSDLYHFIHVLNQQPGSVDQVLNIDRTLWMHAFNYAALNFDSYIGYSQNYYLYKDDNGRFNTIPWDMNMSFGSFRETDGSYHFDGLTVNEMKRADPLATLAFAISPRPLMTNLFKNNTYKRMFIAHMRTIVDENFRDLNWYHRGEYLQSIIDDAVRTDTNKFYSYDFFTENLDSTVGAPGSKDEFPGIKDLIEGRVTFLDSYPGFSGYPVISGILHEPEYPRQGEMVWINATVQKADSILLKYRYGARNKFETAIMFDDGNHHDRLAGDGIFGAGLLTSGSVVQFYLYAENDSAGTFSPERAEYSFYSIQPLLTKGEVSINELMYHNTTIQDETGNYPSWIELSNNANEKISLKDCFLTDDRNSPGKWRFPDTLMTAQGYFVVWTDNRPGNGTTHSDFSLSPVSGNLFLMNQEGSIIDSVAYTDWAEQKSTGRYPDKTGNFMFMEPSFSSSNFPGTTPSSGFLLYPNPVQDKLYFEMENLESPLHLRVIDLTGQILKEFFYSYNPENIPATTKEIDVSGLSQGIYYLRVISENYSGASPFIVL